MEIKYCLPIIEKDKLIVLRTLQEQADNFSYMEVWLDYVDGLDKAFCSELINKYGSKIIFLFRRQNLESPKMPQALKLEILTLLDKAKSIVDLDINDQQYELEYSLNNKLNLNLICSYHNYKETPDDRELESLSRRMEAYNPAIYKVACYCLEQSDSVRLMNLLIKLKSRNKKFIVLGMGEKGLITRLFGTKWGNEMLFAPLEISKSSASGQYTKDKYEKIFNLLK